LQNTGDFLKKGLNRKKPNRKKMRPASINIDAPSL
jgi:hypothetical protein